MRSRAELGPRLGPGLGSGIGLGSVHFLLTLLIPVFLIFMLSCKKAKEERADLGPEVAAESVDDALAKAMDGANLDNLHVGEYLNYVVLRRIENGEQVMVLGGTNISIIDAQDNDAQTETRFTLQINKAYRKNDGSFRNITTEDPLIVEKSQALVAPASLRALSPAKINIQALEQWAKSQPRASVLDDQPKRVSFHRLREGEESIDPPAKVRARADCGGLTDCKIPTHFIRFDLVSWYSDTDYQKVAFDFAFSQHTPFLPFGAGFDQLSGALVTDCRSTYVQLESRNVYVRDCQQIDDFQK